MINWTFLRKHDPALINLRKAARTVLVAPPLFLFFDLYVGNHPNLYVLLIPFYVFLAAYTPSTVGFAVGQASFTSMVVVVFNFVKPLGISTDFVRLETVSLGAITAAIVALILWPRGARAAIAQAVSDV